MINLNSINISSEVHMDEEQELEEIKRRKMQELMQSQQIQENEE